MLAEYAPALPMTPIQGHVRRYRKETQDTFTLACPGGAMIPKRLEKFTMCADFSFSKNGRKNFVP